MTKNERRIWICYVVFLVTILVLIGGVGCKGDVSIMGYNLRGYGYELKPGHELDFKTLYDADSVKHEFLEVQEGESFCFIHFQWETIKKKDD